MKKNIYLEMEQIKDLSASERQAVSYILECSAEAIDSTIVQIGTQSFTSTGTITRVYKKLGIDSFAAFKSALISDLPDYVRSHQIVSRQEAIEPDDPVEVIIDKLSLNSINAITKVAILNTPKLFQTVVNHMKTARQIHLFGSGISNLVSRDALQKGLRSGLNITAHLYYAEMVMQARLAHPNDLCVIISYTGETEEIVKIAKILKMRKIRAVSITSNTNNTIASLCELNLYVDARESFYRVGGMDSRVGLEHVLDILFSIYFSQVKQARDSIEISLHSEDFTHLSTEQ